MKLDQNFKSCDYFIQFIWFWFKWKFDSWAFILPPDLTQNSVSVFGWMSGAFRYPLRTPLDSRAVPVLGVWGAPAIRRQTYSPFCWLCPNRRNRSESLRHWRSRGRLKSDDCRTRICWLTTGCPVFPAPHTSPVPSVCPNLCFRQTLDPLKKECSWSIFY